jgi:hypothetical protein
MGALEGDLKRTTEVVRAALGALSRLMLQGKVREIRCCNFDVTLIDAAGEECSTR